MGRILQETTAGAVATGEASHYAPTVIRTVRRVRVLLALAIGIVTLSSCAGTNVGGDATTAPMIETIAPNGAPERIPATELKPDGAGPFPAVVIMHDCSGLNPGSSGAPGRWARELVARGYVVLVPDSFTPRGRPGGVCTDASPGRGAVSPLRRAHDAYGALAYLRTRPYVDGRRVGVMGGSHGGSTTVASMAAPRSAVEPLARDKRAGFAAAVALYPSCQPWLSSPATSAYTSVAPLLILIGDKDDWTPAEPCRKLAEAAQRAGSPVTIKVYPGAHHSFDSDRPVRYVAARINPNSPSGRGATTGGDPTAWADSIREVVRFFGEHLK